LLFVHTLEPDPTAGRGLLREIVGISEIVSHGVERSGRLRRGIGLIGR
jgi:hypothetical protein